MSTSLHFGQNIIVIILYKTGLFQYFYNRLEELPLCITNVLRVQNHMETFACVSNFTSVVVTM